MNAAARRQHCLKDRRADSAAIRASAPPAIRTGARRHVTPRSLPAPSLRTARVSRVNPTARGTGRRFAVRFPMVTPEHSAPRQRRSRGQRATRRRSTRHRSHDRGGGDSSRSARIGIRIPGSARFELGVLRRRQIAEHWRPCRQPRREGIRVVRLEREPGGGRSWAQQTVGARWLVRGEHRRLGVDC